MPGAARGGGAGRRLRRRAGGGGRQPGAADRVADRRPAPTTSRPAAGRTPTATTPRSTATTPTPTGPAPTLPATYEALELAGHGVTVRLPVPAGWTRRRTALGYDVGDPTGTLLLRVNLTAREPGRTVRESWQVQEAATARQLANYRRLEARDVPGYFDGALDWTFVFDSDRGQRQVVDRLLDADTARVAVYFSALQPDFDRLRPVWDRAQQGLVIS